MVNRLTHKADGSPYYIEIPVILIELVKNIMRGDPDFEKSKTDPLKVALVIEAIMNYSFREVDGEFAMSREGWEAEYYVTKTEHDVAINLLKQLECVTTEVKTSPLYDYARTTHYRPNVFKFNAIMVQWTQTSHRRALPRERT